MIGVFVQVNEGSQRANTHPIGYVIQENGCWQWVGSVMWRGYGVIGKQPGKSTRAHRYLYEEMRGPVPAGLVLDHTCRNRLCVNPDHLEPATNRENTLRGHGPTAANARMSHCKRGHPLFGNNVRLDRRGIRVCKACARDWMRRHRKQGAA